MSSPSSSVTRSPWSFVHVLPSDHNDQSDNNDTAALTTTMVPGDNYYTNAPQNYSGHPSAYFDSDETFWNSSNSTQFNTDAHYPNNAAVVAVLIALICILCLILVTVTVPPIVHMIRRKLPISQARMDRRFATIDGWLIRKVRTYTHSQPQSQSQPHIPLLLLT
jgi:hypothetical protein